MSSININEEHEVAELRRQLAEATRGRDSAEYREACLMYAEAHDGDDKPSVTNLIAWLVSTGTLMAEKLATVIRERDEAKRDLSRIEKSMESAKAIVAEEHEKRVTAERERDELRKNIDDPELDCTDAAHPAWWRGHDHTAKVFCQLVNEILDGNDVSHGISGEPWQATKMRVADLRTKLATAEAERRPTDPESSHDIVKWIVNDIGELGVSVKDCTGRERQLYLYKGGSIEYGNDGDEQRTFRLVGKREFGEVCHPVDYYMVSNIDPTRAENWLLETSPELRQQIVDVVEGRKDNNHYIGSLQRQLKRMERQLADERELAKQREAELSSIAESCDITRKHDAWYQRDHDNDGKPYGTLAEAVAAELKDRDEDHQRLEADAAAMRRTMTENESRLKDVIRRIGVSSTTGWITHELNHVLLDIPSGTASRELIDEMQRKDDRIRELEHLLSLEVQHSRDADEHIERLQRKCRTAKAALVEHYRGKIDQAWFEWQYRKGAHGAIYRFNGTAFEVKSASLGWTDSITYINWKACCDDPATYPCNADGTPLVKGDDDADLLRKLREWIRNGVFTVVCNSLIIGCQCEPKELAELLIAIRDGGAK